MRRAAAWSAGAAGALLVVLGVGVVARADHSAAAAGWSA